MIVRATGIAWYHRADYAKIKTVMIDARKLPDTYDQWLKQADRVFQRITTDGGIVEKVYIDPDTFPAWCAGRGLNVNADARIVFANEFVAVKYRNQS